MVILDLSLDICLMIYLLLSQLLSTLKSHSGINYSHTFFAQWALSCLPEDRLYKSLELFGHPDDSTVEQLIKQFTPPGELRTTYVHSFITLFTQANDSKVIVDNRFLA